MAHEEMIQNVIARVGQALWKVLHDMGRQEYERLQTAQRAADAAAEPSPMETPRQASEGTTTAPESSRAERVRTRRARMRERSAGTPVSVAFQTTANAPREGSTRAASETAETPMEPEKPEARETSNALSAQNALLERLVESVTALRDSTQAAAERVDARLEQQQRHIERLEKRLEEVERQRVEDRKKPESPRATAEPKHGARVVHLPTPEREINAAASIIDADFEEVERSEDPGTGPPGRYQTH